MFLLELCNIASYDDDISLISIPPGSVCLAYLCTQVMVLSSSGTFPQILIHADKVLLITNYFTAVNSMS